jgi:3-oxoacid CoA-transferase
MFPTHHEDQNGESRGDGSSPARLSGQTVVVYDSPAEAVRQIPDGASVAIAGFGLGHRFPSSLILSLRDQGTTNLTVVCNSLGAAGTPRAIALVENGQVSNLIASFSARPGMRTVAEEQIAKGKMSLELVGQGTLVERLRSAGAGIPAFYTATGVGTAIAEGKEVRSFGGRDYVLEQALPVDFAFLRAHRADTRGNVQFRGASQNLNPSFGKAARVCIVEVDEIVEAGTIPPDAVGLPGVFVDGIVRSTVLPSIDELLPTSRARGTKRRTYLDGRPGLARAEVARYAASMLPTTGYVNLGLGIPTLVSNYLPDGVVLHAENGMLGYGAGVSGEERDPDIFNAGGEFVGLMPGASFFDSLTSFEIARGGRLSAVVLGGYQVDAEGNLASWSTPGMVGGGIGGAMDLVSGPSRLIVLMNHLDGDGRPKLVRRCDYPLTGRDCVDAVVTDLAAFERVGGVFRLRAVAEGFTVEAVRSLTELDFEMGTDVEVMQRQPQEVAS